MNVIELLCSGIFIIGLGVFLGMILALFEQANANSDIIYMQGMATIGGIQTQLIANIGKRQAYQEVLEFIRKEQME